MPEESSASGSGIDVSEVSTRTIIRDGVVWLVLVWAGAIGVRLLFQLEWGIVALLGILGTTLVAVGVAISLAYKRRTE